MEALTFRPDKHLYLQRTFPDDAKKFVRNRAATLVPHTCELKLKLAGSGEFRTRDLLRVKQT